MLVLVILVSSTLSIYFLCSMMETTLISITPAYVAQLQEKNPKLHKGIVKFKQDIETPLAAILTLNTIVSTVGATLIGAKVVDIYGHTYLGLASGLLTLVTLFFSEIMPKTLGAKYWRNLVGFMYYTVRVIIFVLRPFLYLSSFVMSVFGDINSSSTVKEEIKALARMGRDEGVLNEDKFRVISNVLSLGEVSAKDVMTPRTVVHMVPPGMTIKDFDKFVITSPFSRFPIVNERKGIYLGYIHKSSSYQAKDTDAVDGFAHQMKSFHADAKLEIILSDMIDSKTHMALVIDGNETWVGIITLEDIIETILGEEIVDETDQVADMRLYAKMRWKQKNTPK